ncbi:hypothetical protein CYMTET_48274 [Cymbomonas tetramitiformis]|uniref:BRCT domain-containing protein n=1 Tax=Cymbomonas tetramitiformis TaxID=36881 RepID=A0AAE0BUB5_9CHLO|nr:hypothetical protein CYMTET_48274 [Cymbomonas tetramitiformis]
MSKRKDTPADSIKRSISGSIFVGCNILAPQAPLGAALLKKVVEDRGGSFHISQKKQSVDVAPTHVLVSESRDAAREIQAQWPKSTLVTREWINKCARAKQRVDEADFSPFCTAAKSTKVSRTPSRESHYSDDEEEEEITQKLRLLFQADEENLNWAVVGKEGRPLNPGWFSGMNSYERMLQCRFRVDAENPGNEELVSLLTEMEKLERRLSGDDSTSYAAGGEHEAKVINHKALVLARAAAVIRACPFNLHDLPAGTARHLLFIGEDTCRYIDEFVETGRCQAYKDLMANGDLKDSKGVLRGVQGAATKREFQKVPFVGHKTACRWYDELGLRSLEEVERAVFTPGGVLNEEKAVKVFVRHALQHRHLLCEPVTPQQVTQIKQMITQDLERAWGPGWVVENVGGARRGKASHDCDFLVTHPSIGLQGVLRTLVERWVIEQKVVPKDMGFHQLHTDHMGHHLQVMVKRVTSGAARGYEGRDSFDHFFGIFHTSEGGKSGMCRADVVMVPPDEWAFALVGWTGSRTYNRILRLHAGHRGMKLTNHTLMREHDGLQVPLQAAPLDSNKAEWWPQGWHKGRKADTEEDIFTLLGLPFRPPTDRNCPS